MKPYDVFDMLEAALGAQPDLQPLSTDKAARALLGLLDPQPHFEAYETAASTHEGAEVFSEAAGNLAALESLSDADVRAATLDGGTRAVVAQALTEVRVAYAAAGPNPSLKGLMEAVKNSIVTLQQARAAVQMRIPIAHAWTRDSVKSIDYSIEGERILFGSPIEGPCRLALSNGIVIGEVGEAGVIEELKIGPSVSLLSSLEREGQLLILQ